MNINDFWHIKPPFHFAPSYNREPECFQGDIGDSLPQAAENL
jgi:hypothetical protein